VSPSACAEANLVIEIDGDSHGPPDQVDYDAARTKWLEERGYRVIRFTAGQVVNDALQSTRSASERRFGLEGINYI